MRQLPFIGTALSLPYVRDVRLRHSSLLELTFRKTGCGPCCRL